MSSETIHSEIKQVLNFWFEETSPQKRFAKDKAFDELIQSRFGKLHEKASANELYTWRESIEGRLAEIIVLDQFSRNLFRDSPVAFAQDAQALALAQEALKHKDLKKLSTLQRAFLYMPFMHSESLALHEIAMDLFKEPGMEENYRFEKLHKEIIEKFGRYPHRNKVLNRKSTAAEIEYLNSNPVQF